MKLSWIPKRLAKKAVVSLVCPPWVMKCLQYKINNMQGDYRLTVMFLVLNDSNSPTTSSIEERTNDHIKEKILIPNILFCTCRLLLNYLIFYHFQRFFCQVTLSLPLQVRAIMIYSHSKYEYFFVVIRREGQFKSKFESYEEELQ